MHKLTKQVLTGVVALGLLAPVVTSTSYKYPVNAKNYMSTYVQSTRRGVWGYSKWNGKDNSSGGKLYHRVYVKAHTKLYGEHDASRIGFNHFVSAFRTNHYTKDTYIPKSAFKAVHHHKRYHKYHNVRRYHHSIKRHYAHKARKHMRKHYRHHIYKHHRHATKAIVPARYRHTYYGRAKGNHVEYRLHGNYAYFTDMAKSHNKHWIKYRLGRGPHGKILTFNNNYMPNPFKLVGNHIHMMYDTTPVNLY